MLAALLATWGSLAAHEARAQALHVVRIDGPFPESPIYLEGDSLVSVIGRYFEVQAGTHGAEIRTAGGSLHFQLDVGPQAAPRERSEPVVIACASGDTVRVDWPVMLKPDSAYDSVSVVVFRERETRQLPCPSTDSARVESPGTPVAPAPDAARDSAAAAPPPADTAGTPGSAVAVNLTWSSSAGGPVDEPGLEMPPWALEITSTPVSAQVMINGRYSTATPDTIIIPFTTRRGRPVPSTDVILVSTPSMLGCRIDTEKIILDGRRTFHCVLRQPGPRRF
jgi:hypothetical protein